MEFRKGRAEIENYVVYSEEGEIIRVIEKSEENTLKPEEWLRGVTCFLINKQGQVLLETRGKNEEDAGVFDLCSGHVNKGEMTIHAIVRELREELNVPFEVACNVKKVLDFELQTRKNQNFFVTAYALFLGDFEVRPQKEEVAEISFKSREEVYDLLRMNQTRIRYNETWEEVFEKVEKLCKEKLVVEDNC